MKELLLTTEEKGILIRLAHRAIAQGLEGKRPDRTKIGEFLGNLSENRASFVTLYEGKRLRGCIGSLIAHRPLALDVMENAYNAAFEDPRFAPLKERELAEICLRISVLTPPEPIHFESEADLIAKLRPGVDGLILRDGIHQATFLPSVWAELPKPEVFLAHLKVKAGMPASGFSKNLRAARYTTEEFS
ncbi:AmmeMemoRadiSam system protein A [Desulfobotulus sp.]|jgi:AmmeMemoRadiSam system protein A|uniref:AmmeMemoRadiSam system protein A n=1 Tax=Desulfobotulus sp. TaxID=1940337 RepID=UPI002A368BB0|nr:AmmeMemoRadiSam system protein A [Desulfobotulus sp.]MDY0164099.1 AmmeMemoRadiSam system protein A [Desulfobotulus sp.]